MIKQLQSVKMLRREYNAKLSSVALCDFDEFPAYFHTPNPHLQLLFPPLPMSS